MKHLTIISGDVSSDGYAYDVAKALLEQDDLWQIHGIGGPKLRSIAPGVLDQSPLGVVGLFEIFKNLKSIWKLRKLCLQQLALRDPHTVLLLDCPGFNMNLLPRLGKHQVIYAIPPQVWAWHQSRVIALKKYCHALWVLYPFEVSFYRDHGIEAEILKHPLAEKPHLDLRPLLAEIPRMKVALLPGSRKSEHHYMMPYYVALTKSRPDIDWVWVEHKKDSLASWYTEMPGVVVEGLLSMPEVHGAVASSGTVTLELAMMGIPSVVIYKLSVLTAMIARRVIKVKWVALPNILLQRCVYPELIQDDLTDESLMNELNTLLSDGSRRAQYASLEDIRSQLDRHSPSLADRMLKILGDH